MRTSQVIALVVLITVSSIAYACYTPADRYAVEVVLNKPGIKYDLARLERMKGVKRIGENAYIYRSSFDERLLVVVSLQSIVSPDTKTLPPPPAATVRVKTGLDATSLDDAVAAASRNYGWQVVYRTPILESGYTSVLKKRVRGKTVLLYIILEEGEAAVGLTVISGTKLTAGDASAIIGELKMILSTTGLALALPRIDRRFVEESHVRKPPAEKLGLYVSVRVQLPLREEKRVMSSYTCTVLVQGATTTSISVDGLESQGWNVTAGEGAKGFIASKRVGQSVFTIIGKAGERGLALNLHSENVTSLDEAKNVFRQAFEAAGLDPQILESCEFVKQESFTLLRITPTKSVDGKTVAEVLGKELLWLAENNIVTGLTAADVEEIKSSASLGLAGWDKRLVWDGTAWKPYYSIKGAYLVRCLGNIPGEYFTFTQGPPMQAGSETGEEQSPPAPKPNTELIIALLVGILVTLIASIYLFIRAGRS